MKKILVISMIAILMSVGTHVVFDLKSSSAQTQSFDNIEVISSGSGYVKFFDKSEGLLYVYNQDLAKCEKIIQITELGQPGVMIKGKRL